MSTIVALYCRPHNDVGRLFIALGDGERAAVATFFYSALWEKVPDESILPLFGDTQIFLKYIIHCSYYSI